MSRTSRLLSFATLLLWVPFSARADDEPKQSGLLRGIQEMMDRLARAGTKPDGFIEPPDPETCLRWCRLKGTVRVGESPLAGSRVELLWVSKDTCVSSRVTPAVTGRDGSFAFPRVPLGEYRMCGADEGRVVWEHSAPVVLTSPGDSQIDVTLGTRKLVVTVLDQELRPVAGASVEREDVPGEFMSFVEPEVTNADGRATLRFLSRELSRLHASVGDASSFMRVYGTSEIESVSMILPPFGTVEVLVSGWEAEGSLGSMRLTCTKDGGPRTLARSLDESGHAVLRCSPGRWELSLEVFGRASMTPASTRNIEVRAGQTIVVDLKAQLGK